MGKSSCILLAGAWIVGCQGLSPLPGRNEVFPAPRPYLLGLAPPVVIQRESRDSGGLPEIPLDTAQLGRSIFATMEREGIFSKVVELEASGNEEACLKEAFDKKMDLALLIRLRGQPTYRFARRTSWFIPNTLVWFFLGFPSWWVRDRVYEVQWDVDFVLYSVSAKQVLQTSFQPFREAKALSVSDQGWNWKALITPPGYYEGSDLTSALAPVVEEKMAEHILAFLENTPLRLPVKLSLREEKTGDKPGILVEVRSPTTLERFRLEVDGRPVVERNPLNLWPPAQKVSEEGNETWYFYSRRFTLDQLPPGEHRVRVLVLAGNEDARIVLLDARCWSASQTIAVLVPGGVR